MRIISAITIIISAFIQIGMTTLVFNRQIYIEMTESTGTSTTLLSTLLSYPLLGITIALFIFILIKEFKLKSAKKCLIINAVFLLILFIYAGSIPYIAGSAIMNLP